MPTISNKLRLFIALLLLVASAPLARASHVLGAELTYRCLNQGVYEFTVRYYRDCSGITAPNTLAMTIASAQCNANMTLTLTQDTMYALPTLCQGVPTNCNGGQAPGVMLHIYRGTTALTMPCGDWVASYTECCRSTLVTNLTNAASADLYLEARLNTQNQQCNRSAVFAQNPVFFACTNVPQQFDLSATDVDGDSLVYSLIGARTAANQFIAYAAPYTAANPFNSPTGVSLSGNGLLSFTLPNVSTCSYVVRVDEYRNGVLVGSVLRDVTVFGTVCNQANTPPVFGQAQVIGGAVNGNAITVTPNNNVTITIPATDADSGQIVSITGAIAQALPNAQVIFSAGQVQIYWTVPQGFQGATLVLTATDNNCPVPASAVETWVINVTCSMVLTGTGQALCSGAASTVQFTASVNGAAGNGIFQWEPAVAFAAPVGAAPNNTATINAPTLFTVTYSDATCTATATWQAQNQPLNLYAVITDAPLCGNSPVTVQLNATANIANGVLAWSPAAAVANPAAWSTTATISQPTTFEAIYTVGACTDTAVVYGGAQAYALTASPNQTICTGQSVQLSAALTGPGAAGNCNQYSVSAVAFAPYPTNQGTSVTLFDDQVSAALPIGFAFPFYCANYTSAYISSNGFLGFTAGMPNGCCAGQLLPSAATPNNVIAMAWNDLNPGAGGTINYYTTGTAPNRRFVVNFVGVPHYGAAAGGPSVTVQAVLHESTGFVEIFNTNVQNDGGLMTQGIENSAGTFAMTVNGRNAQNWTAQNDAWRFAPTPANTSYLWTPAAGLSNPSIANPIAAPAQTTTYVVFATGPNCTLSDTVTVTVSGVGPQIDPVPNFNVCAGDTVQYTLTGTNLANASITWYANNQMIIGQGLTLNYVAQYGQNITVVANAGCGADMDTFQIIVNQAPFFTLYNVQSQAPGAPVTLYVSGYPTPPNTITWTANGAVVGNANPIVVSPTQTTTYTATVSNACGSYSADATVVVPGGPPVLNPLGGFSCVNPGDSVILVANGFNLIGASFVWTDGNGTVLGNTNVLQAFPQTTTTYTVVATNAQGSDTASVTVQVGAVPAFDPYTPPTTCMGQSVQLTLTGQNLNNAQIAWYGAFNQPGTGTTLLFTPQTYATTFAVYAWNGCGSDTTYFVVYAFQPPVTTIIANGPDSLVAVATAGQGPYTFAWSDGSIGSVLTNPQPGVYYVTVTDVNGCTGTAMYTVAGPNYAFSVSVQNATCGNADGSAEIINLQGFGQTAVSWSNGQTGPTASGLAVGTYSVTVTDQATNHSEQQSFTVTEDNACYSTVSGYVFNDDLNQACNPAQVITGIGSQLVHLIELDIYALTDATGYYQFNVPVGNYTLEVLNGVGWDLICPAAPGTNAVNVQANGLQYDGNNFYLSVNQIQNLSVHVVYGLARPGQSYSMTVTWCNYGTQPATGTVALTYPALLQNVAAVLPPATQNQATHTMTWNFANLLPGQCQSTVVYGTVPPTTPIGTPMTGTATVSPVQDDVFPANNLFTWNQAVIAAYDPNYKVVDPQQIVPGQDSLLHYTVHFMNTGNDTAFTVVVRDTLDAQLDLSTIQLGPSSHNYVLSIEGNNILVFTFNNIMLPDSGTNYAASQGYLTFDIELKPGIANFSQVANTAAIYFDFNAPIITNTVVTTALTGLVQTERPSFEVSLMPNPTNGACTVLFDRAVDGYLQLFDLQGRLVGSRAVLSASQVEIDLEGLPNGLYLVRVTNGQHLATARVLKTD